MRLVAKGVDDAGNDNTQGRETPESLLTGICVCDVEMYTPPL
jgi:hypothetical protein